MKTQQRTKNAGNGEAGGNRNGRERERYERDKQRQTATPEPVNAAANRQQEPSKPAKNECSRRQQQKNRVAEPLWQRSSEKAKPQTAATRRTAQAEEWCNGWQKIQVAKKRSRFARQNGAQRREPGRDGGGEPQNRRTRQTSAPAAIVCYVQINSGESSAKPRERQRPNCMRKAAAATANREPDVQTAYASPKAAGSTNEPR